MDDIFRGVTRLLESSVSILEYTDVTQNQLGKNNIVLWNKAPLTIDRQTYVDFKEAINKKHSNKYYLKNETLAYPDFCLALICSIGYTLNHTVTVSIPDRTYTAAWRAIENIAIIGSDSVKAWILPYVLDRSAEGYRSALGISQNSKRVIMPFGNGRGYSTNVRDTEIVSNITLKDKIVPINIVSDFSATNDVTNINRNASFLFSSSFAPDSHLYDLASAHSEYNNKYF